MKKILTVLALLAMFLPLRSLALTAGSLVNNDQVASVLYPATYDDLALDITLPAINGNILQALTIRNTGSARAFQDINAVNLWTDSGPAGWQGWGIDQEIATATVSGDTWVFSALYLDSSSLRLFITVDVKSSAVDLHTINLVIPQLNDVNGNGAYDANDQGMFFNLSANNGPTDNDLVNSTTQYIRQSVYDLSAPEVQITEPIANAELNGSSLTIKGEARDQQRGSVVEVDVGIGDSPSSLTWFTAANPGVDNFITWQYDWQNITAGTYYLSVQAKDNSGNVSTPTSPIEVMVALATTPVIPPPLASSLTLADGMLVKGSDSSKVYVISDQQKRWIVSEAVFLGLGYQWSKIQTVPAEQLASYPAGADLTSTYTHPDGTLVKYATWPEVFLIDNGSRRHIANEATFLRLGYHWGDIITIPDTETYVNGTEIK